MNFKTGSCFAEIWLKERPQPPVIRLALAAHAREISERRVAEENRCDPAIRARWCAPTAEDAQTLALNMASRIRHAANMGRNTVALFEIPLDVFDTVTDRWSSIAVPAAYMFEQELKIRAHEVRATRLYAIAPLLLRQVLDLHGAMLRRESDGDMEGYELLFTSGGNEGDGPMQQIIGYTILREM